MSTSKDAAPDEKAAADAPAADWERSYRDQAQMRARLREMRTFAYLCRALGVPEAVPTVEDDGGAGPPVIFLWSSGGSRCAEIDASEHSGAVRPRWEVTMEFADDGAAEVDFEAGTPDDLLDRLVLHCTRNGVPYRIEGSGPISEEG